MVDVVPRELTDGQLAIEHEFGDQDEPTLTIRVRGEAAMALDAEGQDGINAAIAGHAQLAMLRAVQPVHVVHVTPTFKTERLRTYDPKQGDKAKPDGEDIVAAGKLTRFDPSTGMVEVIDVPEVRTPYWGFDEKIQTNRPLDCPDCTRGLVGDHAAAGDYLRCVQAVVKPDVVICHAGCVLACGMPAG